MGRGGFRGGQGVRAPAGAREGTMGSTAMPARVPVRAIDLVPAAKRAWGERFPGLEAQIAFLDAEPRHAPTFEAEARTAALRARTFIREFRSLTGLAWVAFRPIPPRLASPCGPSGQELNFALALVGCQRRSSTGRAVVAGHLGPPDAGGTLPSRPVSFASEVRHARCGERERERERGTIPVGGQPARHLGGRTGA